MWYEIIGYAASAFIALSLMMNSIIRLRTIGLIGAVLFAIYGFVIGAYPVAFLNILNTFVHAYYLLKIRLRKDFFRILEVRPENKYLIYFIEYNNKKIKKYFPDFEYKLPDENYFTFFIVRNLNVAGVVVGKRIEQNRLHIVLDFVIPEYRDFKIGDYVYHMSPDFFLERGFTTLSCSSSNKKHQQYLLKMGFQYCEECEDNFVLSVKPR